jgi:hypothetical protein
MASGFNLTAQLNLKGPSNIGTIVADIKKQIGTVKADVNLKIDPSAILNVAKLNSGLGNLNKTLANTTTSASSAASAIRSLGASMGQVGAGTVSKDMNAVATASAKVSKSMQITSNQTAKASSEMVEFGRVSGLAIRRFAAFSTVTGVLYSLTNAVNQGISAYIEYDRELVKLQQITGESAAGLRSLEDAITSLSVGLGVSSAELTGIASTLAQAGLGARDTERALKALALSALAPSFDSMNETVEGSIALMRQFGINASDLEQSLGSVNAVAARFAVEASDLITAIQRTGGVFATASRGVSEGTDALNEFLAVFTSVRATTRESAETIATGLRTIFTRIQRGDTIEALKSYGVNLTDLDGKFVGAYKAVELLSNGLSSLDTRDLRFSQIVEELGGFRQIGKVIPLIQQFSTAQEALKVAQEGQGSLAADAAKAQLSLAIQTAKVKQEFLALFRDIGKSDSFQTMAKGALSLASGLIKVADSVKGVLPVLGVIMAFKGASAITQFAGGFSRGVRGIGGARGLGERMGGGGNKMYSGGMVVRKFAAGGLVPGSGDSDNVPAMLTPGEFVLNKTATAKAGINNLKKLNTGGNVQRFKVGSSSKGVRPRPNKDAVGEIVEPTGGTQQSHVGSLMSLSPKQIRSAFLKTKDKKIHFKIEELLGTPAQSIDAKAPHIDSSQFITQLSDKEISFLAEEMGLNAQRDIKLNFPTSYNQALRRGDPDLVSKNKLIQWVSTNKSVTDPLPKPIKNMISGQWIANKIKGISPAKPSSKTYNQSAYDVDAELDELGSYINQKYLETGIDPNVTFKFRGASKSFYGKLGGYSRKTGGRQDRFNVPGKSVGLQSGGLVQQFVDGGVAQRKVGYIDYDVIANPANEMTVSQGMKSTGQDGPRLYTDHLTELAVKARKDSSLQKLRAVYGTAGAGKTTLARGQGTDNARLRQTERFPVLLPEDIQKATEVLVLNSTVSKKKLDEIYSKTDRTYTLSSTTDEERSGVRDRKASRDITGVGLENRKAGSTSSVSTDSAVGEALLGDKLGKKSVVLGRSESGRLRRKSGDELVDVVKKKVGFTWGGFAPMTAGHESIMDAAAAMGIPPEDFIYLVGANEGIKPGKVSSYRTAVFDQDTRVLIAKAGAGARGATVLPKPRDFEVPQAFDISEKNSKRRRVLIPAKGSMTFVADKSATDTEKYKEAGYGVKNIERTGILENGENTPISGTLVRDLIMSGNLGQLQKVLSPGVYDLISNNLGRLQNRANILPSIVSEVQQVQGAKISDVDEEIKKLGIARIDSKKVQSDPEYAAKVEILEQLRSKKKKLQSSAELEPYRLLDALAKKEPDKYALQLTPSVTSSAKPIRTVSKRTQKANMGGLIQKFEDGGIAEELKSMGRAGLIDLAKQRGVSYDQSILDPRKKLSPAEQAKKQGFLRSLTEAGILRQAQADDTSRLAQSRNVAVVGITGDRSSTEMVTPGAVDKDTKASVKGVPVTLQTGSLPPAVAKRVQALIRNRVERLVADVSKQISKSAGLSGKRSRAEIRSITSKDLEDISGSIFEKGLGAANIQYDPKDKSIDFPKGLRPELASLMGVESGVMTDVTNAASKETGRRKLREGQFDRGRLEARAKYGKSQFAQGGAIKKFANAGKVSRGVDIDKEFMKNPMPNLRDKAVSKKLGSEAYDLEKSSGLSRGQFQQAYEHAKAMEYTIEEFKIDLVRRKRIELEKQKAQIKINPSDMAKQLMPQTKPVRPELRALADSLQDTSNDIGYRPSALERNATRQFAGGGTVPALVSNGEAYVPPKLAKQIGYGRLNRMNQADRNSMGRFSGGGISVFKGPGTGTSDSIPANLPVGSFIIREKATKALGFSSGGSVQRFEDGGTPMPVRPDTISSVSIRIDKSTENSMRELEQVIQELGITGSSTSKLLANTSNVSYRSAEKAAMADLDRAKAAGASITQIIAAEQALATVRAKKNAAVGKRNVLESAFSSVDGKTSGAVQQEIDMKANSRASKQIEAIEKSRTRQNEKALITSKKTQDYDQIVSDLMDAKGRLGSAPISPTDMDDINIEASKRVMQRSAAGRYNLTNAEQKDVRSKSLVSEDEKRNIYSSQTLKATAQVTGVSQSSLKNSGVAADDVKGYIQESMMDRKALAQMDAQYRTIRMSELQAAGKTASEAKKLVEQELRDRRETANTVAKQQGIRGPGGTGIMGAVGNVGMGAYDRVTGLNSRYAQSGIGKLTGSMTGNYMAGAAIAALGGQSDNIAGMLGGSKETQAGRSAGIQSATSTVGAGLTLATSVAGIPGIGALAAAATLAGTGLMALVGSAKAAADAQKAYADSLKTKKFEDATDLLSKSMDALSKDVNNLDLRSAALRDVKSYVEASAGTTSVAIDARKKEANEERISKMSTGEYLNSFIFDNSYLQNIAGLKTSEQSTVLGADDYTKIARKEAPKNEEGNRAALQLLEQEIKKGTNFDSLITDDTFKPLREAMARAKPETLAQIIQLEEKMAKTKDAATIEALQQQKDSIITEAARNNKILENIKKTDEMNKAMEAADKAGRQLARTFESMARSVTQAIGRSQFEVDTMEDDMPGDGKLKERRSRDANILQYSNAYSPAERAQANKNLANRMYDPNAAGLAPDERKRRQDQAGKVEKALGFDSFSFANRVTGAGNIKLGENKSAEFKTVSDAANNQLMKEIAGLPEEMQQQIKTKFDSIKKEVDANEKLGDKEKADEFLRKVQDELGKSASDAAEAAKKMALEMDNKTTEALNRFATATNKAIDSQLKAEEVYRKARDIRTESDISLRETLSGGSIGLGERANIIDTKISGMTGGLTDPTQIKTQIDGLNKQMKDRADQRDKDLAGATNNTDRAQIETQATSDLAQMSKQVQSSQKALEELANSTDLATAAMNELRTIQGLQKERLQTLDQVLTSSPQELRKFNESLVRVQQRAMGINPNPSREARKVYNQALRQSGGNRRVANMAAQDQMAQDRAMDLRTMEQMRSSFIMNKVNSGQMSMENATKEYNRGSASVRTQMAYESGAVGMYGNGVLGAIQAGTGANTLIDPAAQRAADTFTQANEKQARANEALAQQAVDDSKTILTVASKQLAEVLENLAERINNIDIKADKDISPPKDLGALGIKMGDTPPGAPLARPEPVRVASKGGVIYASLGKLIDFKPQGTDTVPAMLTPGEFVVNAKATAQNLPLLKAINSGTNLVGNTAMMSRGGVVYLVAGGVAPTEEELEKLETERTDAQQESWMMREAGGVASNEVVDRSALSWAESQVGQNKWKGMDESQKQAETEKYKPGFQQKWESFSQRREQAQLASANESGYDRVQDDPNSGIVGVNFFNEERQRSRSTFETKQKEYDEAKDASMSQTSGVGNPQLVTPQTAAQTNAGVAAASMPVVDASGSNAAPMPTRTVDVAGSVSPMPMKDLSVPQLPSDERKATAEINRISAELDKRRTQRVQQGVSDQRNTASQFEMTDAQMYASQAEEKAPRTLKDFPKPRNMAEVGMYKEGLNRNMTIAEIKNERQQGYLSRFNSQTRQRKEKFLKQRGEYRDPSERQVLTNKAIEAFAKRAKGGDPYADQKSGAAQAQYQAQKAKNKSKTETMTKKAKTAERSVVSKTNDSDKRAFDNAVSMITEGSNTQQAVNSSTNTSSPAKSVAVTTEKIREKAAVDQTAQQGMSEEKKQVPQQSDAQSSQSSSTPISQKKAELIAGIYNNMIPKEEDAPKEGSRNELDVLMKLRSQKDEADSWYKGAFSMSEAELEKMAATATSAPKTDSASQSPISLPQTSSQTTQATDAQTEKAAQTAETQIQTAEGATNPVSQAQTAIIDWATGASAAAAKGKELDEKIKVSSKEAQGRVDQTIATQAADAQAKAEAQAAEARAQSEAAAAKAEEKRQKQVSANEEAKRKAIETYNADKAAMNQPEIDNAKKELEKLKAQDGTSGWFGKYDNSAKISDLEKKISSNFMTSDETAVLAKLTTMPTEPGQFPKEDNPYKIIMAAGDQLKAEEKAKTQAKAGTANTQPLQESKNTAAAQQASAAETEKQRQDGMMVNSSNPLIATAGWFGGVASSAVSGARGAANVVVGGALNAVSQTGIVDWATGGSAAADKGRELDEKTKAIQADLARRGVLGAKNTDQSVALKEAQGRVDQMAATQANASGDAFRKVTNSAIVAGAQDVAAVANNISAGKLEQGLNSVGGGTLGTNIFGRYGDDSNVSKNNARLAKELEDSGNSGLAFATNFANATAAAAFEALPMVASFGTSAAGSAASAGSKGTSLFSRIGKSVSYADNLFSSPGSLVSGGRKVLGAADSALGGIGSKTAKFLDKSYGISDTISDIGRVGRGAIDTLQPLAGMAGKGFAKTSLGKGLSKAAQGVSDFAGGVKMVGDDLMNTINNPMEALRFTGRSLDQEFTGGAIGRAGSKAINTAKETASAVGTRVSKEAKVFSSGLNKDITDVVDRLPGSDRARKLSPGSNTGTVSTIIDRSKKARELRGTRASTRDARIENRRISKFFAEQDASDLADKKAYDDWIASNRADTPKASTTTAATAEAAPVVKKPVASYANPNPKAYSDEYWNSLSRQEQAFTLVERGHSSKFKGMTPKESMAYVSKINAERAAKNARDRAKEANKTRIQPSTEFVEAEPRIAAQTKSKENDSLLGAPVSEADSAKLGLARTETASAGSTQAAPVMSANTMEAEALARRAAKPRITAEEYMARQTQNMEAEALARRAAKPRVTAEEVMARQKQTSSATPTEQVLNTIDNSPKTTSQIAADVKANATGTPTNQASSSALDEARANMDKFRDSGKGGDVFENYNGELLLRDDVDKLLGRTPKAKVTVDTSKAVQASAERQVKLRDEARQVNQERIRSQEAKDAGKSVDDIIRESKQRLSSDLIAGNEILTATYDGRTVRAFDLDRLKAVERRERKIDRQLVGEQKFIEDTMYSGVNLKDKDAVETRMLELRERAMSRGRENASTPTEKVLNVTDSSPKTPSQIASEVEATTAPPVSSEMTKEQARQARVKAKLDAMSPEEKEKYIAGIKNAQRSNRPSMPVKKTAETKTVDIASLQRQREEAIQMRDSLQRGAEWESYSNLVDDFDRQIDKASRTKPALTTPVRPSNPATSSRPVAVATKPKTEVATRSAPAKPANPQVEPKPVAVDVKTNAAATEASVSGQMSIEQARQARQARLSRLAAMSPEEKAKYIADIQKSQRPERYAKPVQTTEAPKVDIASLQRQRAEAITRRDALQGDASLRTEYDEELDIIDRIDRQIDKASRIKPKTFNKGGIVYAQKGLGPIKRPLMVQGPKNNNEIRVLPRPGEEERPQTKTMTKKDFLAMAPEEKIRELTPLASAVNYYKARRQEEGWADDNPAVVDFKEWAKRSGVPEQEYLDNERPDPTSGIARELYIDQLKTGDDERIKNFESIMGVGNAGRKSSRISSGAYSSGGIVYASNGALIGALSRGTDTVPAMLTPGEFVVNRQAAQRHMPILQAINKGYNNQAEIVQHLATGGIVAPKYLSGGGVATPQYYAAGGAVKEREKEKYELDSSGVKQAMDEFKQNVQQLGEHFKSMPTQMDWMHKIEGTVTQHVTGVNGAEARYAQQFQGNMDQVASNHVAKAEYNRQKLNEQNPGDSNQILRG